MLIPKPMGELGEWESCRRKDVQRHSLEKGMLYLLLSTLLLLQEWISPA